MVVWAGQAQGSGIHPDIHDIYLAACKKIGIYTLEMYPVFYVVILHLHYFLFRCFLSKEVVLNFPLWKGPFFT